MEQTQPPKKKKRYWNLIFLALMIGATIYLVFRDHSLQDVWESIISVNPFWFGMAALASLFSTFLLGLALYVSFRKLCPGTVSLKKSVAYALVGSYYSAITPSSTGGQPMQVYHMCADGINASYVSLTMLLVNIAYQLVVLLIPAGLCIFRFRLVFDNVSSFRWLLFFGVFVSITWILFLCFAMFNSAFAKRLSYGIVNLLAKIRIVKRKEKVLSAVDSYLSTYRDGSHVLLQNPKVLALVFLIYVLQMCALFSIPYFIYRAYDLSQYGLIDILALQSALYIAVCFLPLPGAAGATESAFLTLYRVVFPAANIVSAMLLSRLVSFYLILLISGVVSMVMQFRLGRRKT